MATIDPEDLKEFLLASRKMFRAAHGSGRPATEVMAEIQEAIDAMVNVSPQDRDRLHLLAAQAVLDVGNERTLRVDIQQPLPPEGSDDPDPGPET